MILGRWFTLQLMRPDDRTWWLHFTTWPTKTDNRRMFVPERSDSSLRMDSRRVVSCQYAECLTWWNPLLYLHRFFVIPAFRSEIIYEGNASSANSFFFLYLMNHNEWSAKSKNDINPLYICWFVFCCLLQHVYISSEISKVQKIFFGWIFTKCYVGGFFCSKDFTHTHTQMYIFYHVNACSIWSSF